MPPSTNALSIVPLQPCRKPVYIFGEPGLEKDELAALIHFGSARRRQPMAQIDCAQLNAGRADELLGNTSKQGLLAQLDGGTLLLNNVHQVCPCSPSMPCRVPPPTICSRAAQDRSHEAGEETVEFMIPDAAA